MLIAPLTQAAQAIAGAGLGYWLTEEGWAYRERTGVWVCLGPHLQEEAAALSHFAWCATLAPLVTAKSLVMSDYGGMLCGLQLHEDPGTEGLIGPCTLYGGTLLVLVSCGCRHLQDCSKPVSQP